MDYRETRGRGNPEPKVFQGGGSGAIWVVDLRRWALSQKTHLGPAEGEGALTATDALHAAWGRILDGQRAALMADGESPDARALGAPRTVAGAIDAWEARKRYDNPDSAAWGAEYAGLVRRELGHVELWTLAPPAGNDTLLRYADDLRARGRGPRTMRNRFSILLQALRFAVDRGWLRAAPPRPELPALPPPVFRWVTEGMFRKLRAATYAHCTKPVHLQAPGVKDAASLRVFVARRRCYLSCLFYFGLHHRDANNYTADWLFLDGGAYIRHNSKSARCVPDEQFEMPEPMAADLRELAEIVGRPFYPGERIFGGPWPNVNRVLNATAAALEFPHEVPPAVLRRSFAREMFLRGYSVEEVADRMGHVDLRMLRQIYVRTPRPAGRVVTRWTMPAPEAPAAATPSGMAKVFDLVPPLDGERRPPVRLPGKPEWLRRKDTK